MSGYRNHRKSFGKLERADKVIEREKAEAAEQTQETPVAGGADAVQKSEKKTVYFDREYEEMPDFAEIIGISFRGSGKVYYFAANGNVAKDGDGAIVETARGVEYGKVVLTNKMVSKKELVLPLKSVIRIATDQDNDRFEENKKKEKEAFELCQKKIVAHGLDMKLIEAEYTFDNTKLLFYFTSDDRVDFRDLVKDLAGAFKTRIELRQIGIRDEAKIMGGLGVCGREFCCHSFLPDFVQVSIKMAKEQNLALNSAKISGACGRLMCCLRYEYDTYQEESRRTPKVDSRVMTPDGPGKVVEAKPLLGLVKIALDENLNEFKIYDRELLRPETEDEYRDALEKKALRDKKEAERVQAKAAAAAKLAEAKEAALAKANERARISAEKRERAARNAQRQQQRNGDESRNQQKNAENAQIKKAESGVKNENPQKQHKNRHNRNRHRRPKNHSNGEKSKKEQ